MKLHDIELWHGRAEDLLPLISSKDCQLVVTSPPFDSLRQGISTYCSSYDFGIISKELFRIGCPVIWERADQIKNGALSLTTWRELDGFIKCGFLLHDEIIYQKSSIAYTPRNRYIYGYERCLVLFKDKITVNVLCDRKNLTAGRKHKDGRITQSFGPRTNIWKIDSGKWKTTKDSLRMSNGQNFNAPIPEALARDLILSFSNPKDRVLSCFLGSGTEGKMAMLSNRRFLGTEVGKEAFELAVSRIESHGRKAGLIGKRIKTKLGVAWDFKR